MLEMKRDLRARPILLYLVTEDWYFLSHRLPMALAAQHAGYDVHVATRVNDNEDAAAIRDHGFTLHPLAWNRGRFNPLDVLRIVRQVRRLYRDLEPELVHHVALQPALIGSLAAVGLPVSRVNALAGLGYGFTSGTLKARLLRFVLAPAVRLLLNNLDSLVLVQNPDDRDAVEGLGVSADHVFIVPGSGVDVTALTPLPEPSMPVTVAFVGRLLHDKGVGILIDAWDLLARRGDPVRLLLAGDRDPANPASVTEKELEEWRQRPNVDFLGHVSDIGAVWARAHIAVLPSRREGLPKSLLEAAACGRPLIASDVPGCREIARDGVNALLIPPDDPVALADAVTRLAADAGLRRRLGAAGRKLVEQEFSSERVGHAVVALYAQLLNRKRRLLPDAVTNS
jgi:glycosyltransferase involved in cell wall biosynthesis